MKREKTLDCVAMKAGIQERLLRESADLGEEEARKRRAERLSRDPILGGFLRKKKAMQQGTTEHTPSPKRHDSLRVQNMRLYRIFCICGSRAPSF